MRAIVLMLAMSIAVAAVLVFHDRLPAAVSSLMTDDVSTLNSRTELWAASVKYVLARPILGAGYFASRYLLVKEFPWAGHAHNSFLEVLITTGLVGLLILLAFVFYVIKKGIKTRSPLLLGVTVYCLIQGMMNPLYLQPWARHVCAHRLPCSPPAQEDRDVQRGCPFRFGERLGEGLAV